MELEGPCSKGSPLNLILIQTNTVHTLTSYLYNIYFHITFLSKPISQVVLAFQDFRLKCLIPCALLTSNICDTFPTHFIQVYMITLIIFGEEFKLSLLHTHVPSPHEAYDSPEQAAHYHTLDPKSGASSLTRNLAGLGVRWYCSQIMKLKKFPESSCYSLS
jgi:hypothetical protein